MRPEYFYSSYRRAYPASWKPQLKPSRCARVSGFLTAVPSQSGRALSVAVEDPSTGHPWCRGRYPSYSSSAKALTFDRSGWAMLAPSAFQARSLACELQPIRRGSRHPKRRTRREVGQLGLPTARNLPAPLFACESILNRDGSSHWSPLSFAVRDRRMGHCEDGHRTGDRRASLAALARRNAAKCLVEDGCCRFYLD